MRHREQWRRRVPMTLVCLRAALAGTMAGAAVQVWPGWAFVVLLTAGLLSDVYDGVLARRWDVATPTLRWLDSATDVLFYAAALYAGWRLHPVAVGRWEGAIVGLLALEGLVQVTSLLQWHAVQATHSWAAKVWGFTLWAAFVVLLGYGRTGGVPVALAVGYAADAEVLVILLLSPVSPVDVRSLPAAWRLRRSA